MRLEYFADPASDHRPVLLPYGGTPTEVEVVRIAIDALGSGDVGAEGCIDGLGVVEPIDGCPLVAVVSAVDLGVVPLDLGVRAFRCALRPASWESVAGLLAPFATAGHDRFQYLTQNGEIDWIVSTSRAW